MIAGVFAALGLAGCTEEVLPPLRSSHASRVMVAAEVLGVSATPDVHQSPYADCLIVCELRVLDVEEGKRVPRDLLAAVPGFLGRELQRASELRPGQVCRLELPRDPMEKGDLAILQMVDEIEKMDMPLYYTREVWPDSRKAADFPPLADGCFGPSTDKSTLGRALTPDDVKYPWSHRAAAERSAAIAEDLKRIRTLLADNGGDWAAWDKKLAPFHADLRNKMGKLQNGNGITNGNHFFRSLRNKEYAQVTADPNQGPLMMISSMHQQLRDRGIDLLVVPFPAKEMVNAKLFSDMAPADGVYSAWRLKFTHDLLTLGVEVLDLTTALQKNTAGHDWLFYDAADLHPADGAIQIAAEEIAKRLERYELKKRKDWQGKRYRLESAVLEVTEGSPLHEVRPGAKYPVTRVIGENGHEVQVLEQSPSPVVIMGDSFTVVPGPTVSSASIPAHMARHLGEVPAQLISMGGSDKAMRMLAREGGDYLVNRAVIVFIFSPSRLLGAKSHTEDGGWDLYKLPPIHLR